jgi:peptidoglycan-N-acetylglucosamine deacetylase
MDAPKASGIRQLARAALAAAIPRRSFLVRGPRRCRSICLTFDDGPHPEFTPRYLDLLAEHQVPATFFVVGQNAERHPGLVRRMLADGHAVGNHTYSHRRRAELSTRGMAEEIRRGAQAVRDVCGQFPSLFRPPGGKVTAADLWGLFWSGQTVVLWNQDPKDFAGHDGQEVVDWFRSHTPQSGDLVLLHDVHQHALVALPEVISTARRNGIGFASICDWAGRQWHS